eukprot:Nk52_evm66s207 gene=Nk52_evmTU66s207
MVIAEGNKGPMCGRDQGEAESRGLHVHSSAEVQGVADKAVLNIHVSSKKKRLEDAKQSVERRLKYIASSCSNKGVSMRKSYRVDTSYSRFEESDEEECKLYEVNSTITVYFQDLKKCEEVYNLLTEKLDPTVKILPPEYEISTPTLMKLRQEAVLQAVKLAKDKAKSIADTLGQVVVQARYVEEKELDIIRETRTKFKATNLDNILFSEQELSYVRVPASVFVIFELGKKTKKRR